MPALTQANFDALSARVDKLDGGAKPAVVTESAAGKTVAVAFSTLQAAIAGGGVIVGRAGGTWRLVASAASGNQIERTAPDGTYAVDLVTAQVSKILYATDRRIWQQAQTSGSWWSTDDVAPPVWTAGTPPSVTAPVTVPPVVVAPSASGMAIALNCHIDFGAWGMVPPYADTPAFIAALKYLWGTKPPLLRDFPNEDADLQRWLTIRNATGARFIAAINEASPSDQEAMLNRMPAFANAGLLYAIEGGNEEDDSYPQGLGATLADTALRQRRLYAMGQQLKLPVVNMSFGAGWTAANNWQGNYDKVGDLSAYCDFANAHTYPQPGDDVAGAINRLNGLAKLAATTRPVWITEIGWQTSDVPNETQRAQLLIQSIAAAKAGGCALWAWYAAVDDGSGKWGLFNDDWTPRASAVALRNYLAAV